MSSKRIDDPQALGIQYQLGNYRTTYKTSSVGTTTLYVVYIFFLVVGISITGPATILTAVFSLSDKSFSLFFLCFGLLWTGLLLWALVWVYQHSGLHVFVYDYGLICVQHGSLRAVYWQNVAEVRHAFRVYRGGGGLFWLRWEAHTYTINCTDNTSYKLKWIFMKKELGKIIEVETARYIFHAVQTNPSVNFGPLTVTPQGLYYESALLPWHEVGRIEINENSYRLVIKQQEKWFRWASVKLAEVPNVEVFKMLVPYITGGYVNVYSAWKTW